MKPTQDLDNTCYNIYDDNHCIGNVFMTISVFNFSNILYAISRKFYWIISKGFSVYCWCYVLAPSLEQAIAFGWIICQGQWYSSHPTNELSFFHRLVITTCFWSYCRGICFTKCCAQCRRKWAQKHCHAKNQRSTITL